MKNSKILVVLTGIAGLLLGGFCAGKTDFQKKLSRHVKVDTSKYMANIDCVDTHPNGTRKG